MTADEQDLLRRAYAAYFKGGGTDQPAELASGLETSEAGKKYVVLRNTHGVLAVYRVRNDGVLKGMKRWPAEINE